MGTVTRLEEIRNANGLRAAADPWEEEDGEQCLTVALQAEPREVGDLLERAAREWRHIADLNRQARDAAAACAADLELPDWSRRAWTQNEQKAAQRLARYADASNGAEWALKVLEFESQRRDELALDFTADELSAS